MTLRDHRQHSGAARRRYGLRGPAAASALALALGLACLCPPGWQEAAAAASSASILSADADAVPTPRPRPYAGTPRARPFTVSRSLPLPRPTTVALVAPRARPQDLHPLTPRPAPRGHVELPAARPLASDHPDAGIAPRPRPESLPESRTELPLQPDGPAALAPDTLQAPAAIDPQSEAEMLARVAPAAGTPFAPTSAAVSPAPVSAAREALGISTSDLPSMTGNGNVGGETVAVAMAFAPLPLAAPRPDALHAASWPDPLAGIPAPRPRPALTLRPPPVPAPAFGPAGEARPTDSLNILSDQDAALYARAFDLQADADWDEADRVIRRIGDPLLMGHLREQRLMHPNGYRASFAELQRWMRSYADHPDADRVYRLARQRQPGGTTLQAPAPPDLKVLDLALLNRADGNAGNRASAPRAANETTRRGSLKTLKAAYFSGKWPRALEIALRLSETHGSALPGAAWYAGLAAWRLQRYEVAAGQFAALAAYDAADGWERSAGGYWAARAYLTLGRPTAAIHALRQAAEHSRTFYGLLAARRLGLDPVFGWTKLSDDESLVDALFKVGAVRRALALAQSGQTTRARAELRQLMDARRKVRDDVYLPMLTALLGLTGDAQTAYRMARIWQVQTGEHIDPAMFPEPPWQPEGGFTFDRALIYAFVRKESRFDPVARSPAGARGLMQLMPATARFVNGGSQNLSRILNDPAGNLELGQRYIRHLERDVGLGSDLIRIAIAYNAGPGNLEKWDRLAQHGGDPLLLIESLPSAETRDFVERILANLWVYRARLDQPSPSLDDLARGAWPRYVPLDQRSDRGSKGHGAG